MKKYKYVLVYKRLGVKITHEFPNKKSLKKQKKLKDIEIVREYKKPLNSRA